MRPITFRLGRQMACLVVSLWVHIVCMYAFSMFGRFNFGAPVMIPSVVSVDLKEPLPLQPPPASGEDDIEDGAPAKAVAGKPESGEAAIPAAVQESAAAPEPPAPPLPVKEPTPTPREVASAPAPVAPAESKSPQSSAMFELLQPLRTTGEFLAFETEKLSYRIYLLGMPVGSALLEARREKGEVRIRLRVTSDAVISSIYPVDDLIETRHINGNFITSTIRQTEGSFRGDRGFTIFLREKSVFWIDRLTRRSLRESVPTSEVVDLLSGLYYLRNRQLQVGSSETLHVYDSDRYAAVPVEVLRRETVRVSGVRTVPSLLVVPQMETGGIFRRTGDIRIWLSDDEFRVPVKVETDIPLGRVTAELVDAESKR